MSKSKSYLYAAVSYLERKQLQRNINLAGTRGKKIVKTGGISYELQDGYRVLEGIKNTPRYWKTAKYEIIAKIENFGAFQFFFTLSCADMRWMENFVSIFAQQRDVNISIDVKDTEESQICINGVPLHEHLKNMNKHELIKDNVMIITQNFDKRVRSFFKHIVMGKNEPMKVKFYNYRVEFQLRGAGHIHGVLWIDLAAHEDLFPGIQSGFPDQLF